MEDITTIHTKLDKSVYARLKQHAEKDRRTIHNFTVVIIESYLDWLDEQEKASG